MSHQTYGRMATTNTNEGNDFKNSGKLKVIGSVSSIMDYGG